MGNIEHVIAGKGAFESRGTKSLWQRAPCAIIKGKETTEGYGAEKHSDQL